MNGADEGDEYECPEGHGHGVDTVCYIHHGCRCRGCRDGVAERMRVRRRELAYGTYTRAEVPAAPVREYLEYLSRSGMGTRTVSRVTGISTATLSGIRWGRHGKDGTLQPAKMVDPGTAHRIMRVQPDVALLPARALVDARGTIRRLQALQAIGWPTRALARRLGVKDTNVSRTMHEAKVTAAKARAVAALFDELWDTHPPTSTPSEREAVRRTTARAAARGWVPPLGWDDIDTDLAPAPVTDERASFDPIAVELAVSGGRIHLTREERLAALPRLHAHGHLDGALAALLLVDVRTIERDRKHLGLPANYYTERQVAA